MAAKIKKLRADAAKLDYTVTETVNYTVATATAPGTLTSPGTDTPVPQAKATVGDPVVTQ